MVHLQLFAGLVKRQNIVVGPQDRGPRAVLIELRNPIGDVQRDLAAQARILADAPILSDAHEKKSLSYIEQSVNIYAPLESEAANDSSRRFAAPWSGSG